jgi:DNA-binding NarL/FixJ family response regulator
VAVDDRSDPARSAVRLADLAGYANDAGEFDLEHSASDRSSELMPRDRLSRELAEVLANHASSLRLRGEYRASLAEAVEARRVCALVEANDLLLELDAHVAQARAYLGHTDAALAAVDAIEASGDELFALSPWQTGSVVINPMAGLYAAGCFAEILALDARFAPAFADHELQAWVTWLDMCAGSAQFQLGDWSDAGLRIDRYHVEPLVGFLAWGREIRWRWLLGARGEARPAAWGPPPEPREAPDPGMRAELGAAEALVSLWNGDPVEAARVADEALDALVGSEEVAMTAWVVAVTMRAWADVAEGARATRRTGRLERALTRVAALDDMAAAIEAGTYLEGAGATPFMRTLCAASHAERGRAEDRSDARAWRAVAAAYDDHGTRPAAAYARYRLSEAYLGRGDQENAASSLAEVIAVATEIGAVPLARLAGDLARRARLRLEVPSSSPEATMTPNPWGLSDRERAVLDLIAEGRTNREIGDALFITDKTASAHVTHILAKLGVSSRTEAALLAARAGAVDAGG